MPSGSAATGRRRALPAPAEPRQRPRACGACSARLPTRLGHGPAQAPTLFPLARAAALVAAALAGGPAHPAAAKETGREAAKGLGPRRCRDRRDRRRSERRPGTATYRGTPGSEAQAQRSALHLRALLPDPPRPWRGAPKRGRAGRCSEAEGKRQRTQAPAPSHRGTGARAGGTLRAPVARVIDRERQPLGGREANVRLGEEAGFAGGQTRQPMTARRGGAALAAAPGGVRWEVAEPRLCAPLVTRASR